MNEEPPKINNDTQENLPEGVGRKVSLAVEMIESGEVFQFPGIKNEVYNNIKSGEEEFPGYATPIDELIDRFKNEGVKVVFGDAPESGNVFILPANSFNLVNDSLFPRHLYTTEGMNEKLLDLILLDE